MARPWPEQRGSAVYPPRDVRRRCVKAASPRAPARPDEQARDLWRRPPPPVCAHFSRAHFAPRAIAGTARRSHVAVATRRRSAPNEEQVSLRGRDFRSEEQTSELQSLMRLSYAVFSLTK